MNFVSDALNELKITEIVLKWAMKNKNDSLEYNNNDECYQRIFNFVRIKNLCKREVFISPSPIYHQKFI